MQPILVYVTISTLAEAEMLAEQLVEDKLIACATLYPGVRSVYPWDGNVRQDDEVSIILKTQAELWEKLCARIVDLHPYECPAILAIPVHAGHHPYLQWLYDTTTL